MSFDNKLSAMLEDIEIPEELSPENIEAMLMRVNPQTAEHTVKERNITAKRSSNRIVIMRTIAAAAACVALAAGFWAFTDNTDTAPIELEDEIEYEAVKSVETYDELYNIYTGIYLRNSENNTAQNGDGVEIGTSETAITQAGTQTPQLTEPPVVSSVPAETITTAPAETEISAIQTGEEFVTGGETADLSGADIITNAGDCIYYISSDTLYTVSRLDMTILSSIELSHSPTDMYCQNGSLVILSGEVVSDNDSQQSVHNVIVDIYDIAVDTTGIPEHIKTYKQNGMLTSVRMSESGTLYLVTVYADYRTAPLNENSPLESFVPGYYIDSDKYYVAPSDIIVPANANSTDYTVVSSISCENPDSISVKAVLGSSVNAYAAEDMLYIAGVGVKDGIEYTIITSFEMSENGLSYTASGSVEGSLIGKRSMGEANGLLCVATSSSSDGVKTTSVYVLDKYLTSVKSAGQLLPGVTVASVSCDNNFISLYSDSDPEPALVIDLSQNELTQSSEAVGYHAPYVNRFSDSRMVGITSVSDSDGTSILLMLEMYDSYSGEKLSEIAFAEYTDVTSPALTDKKAMLIDEESRVIGIPVTSVNEFAVKNQYYFFTYDDSAGFVQSGVIEFNDLDFSFAFERAMVEDGIAYLFGSGRAVSVRLSDMTVLQTFEFTN